MLKALKVILPPIIIIFGGFAVAAALVSSKQPPQRKPKPVQPLLVEVDVVQKQDLNYRLDSQGAVMPKLNTALVSQVNGKVVEVADAFVAGGFFNRGDVLVRIDPADYKTAVKTAEANLARANASLLEERARAKVAENEWKSFMTGNAPELYLRKPQLARELANVRSAEADLERAKRDLERTVISAPYDGMVKSKSVDLGQFVTLGSTLGSVYGTEVAEVRLPLTDTDLGFVTLPRGNRGGEPLKVTLSATAGGKTHHWQASIVRDEGVVDEKTRVTYAVAEVVDPYGLKSDKQPLPFGRFVKAAIEGDFVRDVIKLPRHVITSDDEVLMINEMEVHIRPITIVRKDETHVYVSEGLAVGDVYATSVIPNPMNGMKVKVVGVETDESEPQTDATAQVVAGN